MSLPDFGLSEEEELKLRLSKVGAFSMKIVGDDDIIDGGESDRSLDLPDSFEQEGDQIIKTEQHIATSGRTPGRGDSNHHTKEIASLLTMLASKDFPEFVCSV